jgi:hypothetical protein
MTFSTMYLVSLCYLNVILSVVKVSVSMLSVVRLNVVRLSVVAPFEPLPTPDLGGYADIVH